MRAEHHGNIEFRRIDGGKNNEDKPERRLSVREAALIQTFPPTCILTEPKKPTSKAYKPIGNAVPPLLGYIVARKVLHILELIRGNPWSKPPSFTEKKTIGKEGTLLCKRCRGFRTISQYIYRYLIGGRKLVRTIYILQQ